MYNIIFNLSVDEKIEKQLLKEVQFPFVDIERLKDIEDILICYFDIYSEQSNEVLNILEKCRYILVHKSKYTIEEFYTGVYNTLYQPLLNQTKINLFQNGIDKIEDNNEQALEDMESLSIMLENALTNDIYIEKDFNYNIKQKILVLEETINKLSNEFSDIEFSDDIIVNNNVMNISELKKIEFLNTLNNAKMNYLATDKSSIFYIDLLNIIYGYFNILKVISKYDKKIESLKFMIDELESDDGLFSISNFLRNLVKFKEKINLNQVLQYVTLYYYEVFLKERGSDFESYKSIIALIFDKQRNKIYSNKFEIEEICRPFEFLLYPSMIEFPNQDYIKVYNLCGNFEFTEKFLSLNLEI